VDNFDYSQPFQQLADRGWAVVEGQSIVVVLHPGGVVLEGDHHEIVPEHAFEIVHPAIALAELFFERHPRHKLLFGNAVQSLGQPGVQIKGHRGIG